MTIKIDQPELIRLNKFKIKRFDIWPTILMAIFTGFAIVFFAVMLVINLMYLGLV